MSKCGALPEGAVLLIQQQTPKGLKTLAETCPANEKLSAIDSTDGEGYLDTEDLPVKMKNSASAGH